MRLSPPLAPLLLLALLAAGGAWLWAVQPAGDGTPGAYPIRVEGPGGQTVFNGTVEANGTPLAALLAAARQGGFEVDVDGPPPHGRACSLAYVRAIAGHAAQGTAGWEYWVRSGEGRWKLPNDGAACFELHPGDVLLWRWTDAPSSGSLA